MPRRALRTPDFQAAATGPMEFGLRIGGVNEHVHIDKKHLTSAFHPVVQSLAIGDINKMASTPKSWEWAKFRFRLAATGLKKQPQRRFDELGHRLTLPSCFPPEGDISKFSKCYARRLTPASRPLARYQAVCLSTIWLVIHIVTVTAHG
jgi:hypothetical protein